MLAYTYSQTGDDASMEGELSVQLGPFDDERSVRFEVGRLLEALDLAALTPWAIPAPDRPRGRPSA